MAVLPSPSAMLHDTIAAISTALGEAAISVVRASGPQALSIAAQVLKLSLRFSRGSPAKSRSTSISSTGSPLSSR